MTNNDILRRLRYSLNYNDSKMQSVFALANNQVILSQLTDWLKKEDEQGFSNLPDQKLASFLNGLIIEKRGKRDDSTPVAESRLNNNLILTKLKIAFNFKAEDIITLLKSVNFNLSKGELSALFRRADHPHFRQCKDQILRNFLTALQHKLRGRPASNKKQKSTTANKTNTTKVKKPKANDGAKPNASKLYVNPNASKAENKTPKRSQLKLKPEQIWGKSD